MRLVPGHKLLGILFQVHDAVDQAQSVTVPHNGIAVSAQFETSRRDHRPVHSPFAMQWNLSNQGSNFPRKGEPALFGKTFAGGSSRRTRPVTLRTIDPSGQAARNAVGGSTQ